MLKADLKEKWNRYCDTDALVDSVMDLLTKYNHRNTEHGVCALLDAYFEAKHPLIDMFMGSQHYVGNMRICLDVEMERDNNANEIEAFCDRFPMELGVHNLFYEYTDENGKTAKDYETIGMQRFNARSLIYGDTMATLQARIDNKRKFRRSGETRESYNRYVDCKRQIFCFAYNPTSTLTESTVNSLTQYKIDAKFAVGMKTSRAFNRLCHLYGIDTLPEYNRQFAAYADMVSDLKRKLKFFISLNPLDYLTMSFGRSWASCHTIDQSNLRNMPNAYHGMYCGGTVSYMLDKCSFITYVHDHYTEDVEEGKIYRNMFHYDDGTLVQGRIYPQGNDGATDLYKTFRGYVQAELAEIMHLNENKWVLRNCSCGENTITNGVHYADYIHFNSCNVTYPKEMPMSAYNVVNIGAKRICPDCGCIVDNDRNAGSLVHADCNHLDW